MRFERFLGYVEWRMSQEEAALGITVEKSPSVPVATPEDPSQGPSPTASDDDDDCEVFDDSGLREVDGYTQAHSVDVQQLMNK